MGEMEFFSVGVKNVQSIESLDFDFPVRESGGSFVTFVGPSSSGKSALLRAMHALVNNTSSAAVLLRSGAKKFEVGATTANGYVKITRGASLSTYTLGAEDYTKAGTSVPEPVQSHLGFKEPDLHLRFQFDRPYLLDATSGQAAAALARLSHAHILRDAAGKASKVVRQKTSDLSVLESEKASAQQALEDLGDVEAQRQQVEQAAEAFQEIQQDVSRAAQAQQTLQQIHDCARAAEDADAALSAIPDLSEEFHALREGADWLQEVEREVQQYNRALQVSEQSVVTDTATVLAQDVAAAEEIFSSLRVVSDLVQSIHQSSEEGQKAEDSLRTARAGRVQVEGEVQQVRESMQVCPTCGQEVGAA